MHLKDLFDLTNKTAIITGGGRGLGEQMATALAEAGANLVLCSRKVEACQEVADRLAATGVQTLALACDVANPADVEKVVQTTVEHFGAVHILINNSGATWGAPAAEMPLEAWKKVMDVNVTGTFLMCQAAGRVMIAQGKGGKIINIASTAGLGGVNPRVMDAIGYSTSKGAMITFTKDLAVKWGPHQINVNAIAPGFFPTKMSRALIEREQGLLLKSTPLRRFGSADDLKGATVFLASKASDFVTGAVLVVDGGSSAQQ
ncbi:SDR family oxidoreductase [Alicyclobacillaceae bacterium I2511]|nr:SDR family oxidoreductase [Alicyclobacillaceae bacterium I2511]